MTRDTDQQALKALIARIEALSPETLDREINAANAYLRSEAGQREFGHMMNEPSALTRGDE